MATPTANRTHATNATPDVTPGATPEAIEARARALGSGPEGLSSLLAETSDRHLLEAARDRLAVHIHTHADDFQGTAALQLLNRALSALPRHDPLDWRVRWGQRFRMP